MVPNASLDLPKWPVLASCCSCISIWFWGKRGRGDTRGRSGRASPWLRPAGNPRSGNRGRSGCGPTPQVTSSRVTEAAPTALARGPPRGRPWVSTASGCVTRPCAPWAFCFTVPAARPGGRASLLGITLADVFPQTSRFPPSYVACYNTYLPVVRCGFLALVLGPPPVGPVWGPGCTSCRPHSSISPQTGWANQVDRLLPLLWPPQYAGCGCCSEQPGLRLGQWPGAATWSSQLAPAWWGTSLRWGWTGAWQQGGAQR